MEPIAEGFGREVGRLTDPANGALFISRAKTVRFVWRRGWPVVDPSVPPTRSVPSAKHRNTQHHAAGRSQCLYRTGFPGQDREGCATSLAGGMVVR